MLRLLLCIILAGGWSLTAQPATIDPPRDLDARKVDPLALPDTQVVVLLFVAIDCPVANRYAPAINALVAKFGSPTLRFFAVYPDANVTPELIRQHQQDYDFRLPALHDPDHTIVARAGATVTPEAAVFLMPTRETPDGVWIYRGRIDDQYESVGRSRSAATRHDLEEVLTMITAGQPPLPRTTKAIGCYLGH